jgi:hypothetical protein
MQQLHLQQASSAEINAKFAALDCHKGRQIFREQARMHQRIPWLPVLVLVELSTSWLPQKYLGRQDL